MTARPLNVPDLAISAAQVLRELAGTQCESLEPGVRLGAGRGLMKKRPSDKALVRGGFASEWEMNG